MRLRKIWQVALLGVAYILLCGQDAGKGDPCDSATFVATCSGDVLTRCHKDKILQMDCSEIRTKSGVKSTCVEFLSDDPEECDEEDGICSTKPKARANRRAARCVHVDEQCSKENAIKEECSILKNGRAVIIKQRCEKTKDGRLFYHGMPMEQCYQGFGVCTEDGKCAEPESCNYETYCDGDVLHECSKNRQRIVDCAAMNQSCETINGKTQCVPNGRSCSVEGEISAKCNSVTGSESRMICTRAEDGKLYYQRLDHQRCLDGCKADGSACKEVSCKKTGEMQYKCIEQGRGHTSFAYTCSEQKGKKIWTYYGMDRCSKNASCTSDGLCSDGKNHKTPEQAKENADRVRKNVEKLKSAPKVEQTAIPCDKDTFVPYCDGNDAVMCQGRANKLVRKLCSTGNNPGYCAVVDAKPLCVTDSDVCTKEGDVIADSCHVTKDSRALLHVKECRKSQDGGLYYVPAFPRTCAKGCNAEGTGCSDNVIPDGKSKKQNPGNKKGKSKDSSVSDELWNADW